jgi:type IV secretion system protein VirB9
MKKIYFVLLIIFTSISTFALQAPKASRFDSRVQEVNYNEDNIVEINAYPGISTHIRFAPEETILDIASGFSDGWEFAPRRNNLYLKPKSIKGKNEAILEPIAGKWDTDLHVTTNLRVYTFQLVLHPEGEANKLSNNLKIAYLIKFKYPAEEAAKTKLAAQQRAAERQLAQQPLPRNWNYSMQVRRGSEGVAPSMAYDDGRFTYLRFPGNREFPAVFVGSRR